VISRIFELSCVFVDLALYIVLFIVLVGCYFDFHHVAVFVWFKFKNYLQF